MKCIRCTRTIELNMVSVAVYAQMKARKKIWFRLCGECADIELSPIVDNGHALNNVAQMRFVWD